MNLLLILLGAWCQVVAFAGWPVRYRTLMRRFVTGEVVLSFINEQSLWLMTVIYWYLRWHHTLLAPTHVMTYLMSAMTIVITGFVGVAAFTRIALPSRMSVLLYVWYLVLDLYISLVFLIRSPSNIFVDIALKSPFDYFFFGMVFLHLICLVQYIILTVPWPRKGKRFGVLLHEWHQHMHDLGSRYLDKQGTVIYPIVVTVIAIGLLVGTPIILPVNDFAAVGFLVGIGTWITGQRAAKPKGWNAFVRKFQHVTDV